jgi:hypothetical protein
MFRGGEKVGGIGFMKTEQSAVVAPSPTSPKVLLPPKPVVWPIAGSTCSREFLASLGETFGFGALEKGFHLEKLFRLEKHFHLYN